MAWIRQLPSGLWAATVHTPAGRITQSHELRSVITRWATSLEEDIRRADFVDPRLGRKTVGECWEQFADARRLEAASRARDASHWRTWVEPRWGRVQVGAVTKPDVQAWVNQLEEDGVGGWSIIAAVNVLKAVMELAVDAGWIRSNPARRVKTPLPPRHEDRVIEPEEERLLLDRLDEILPGRRDARPFVETMLETGGRWEEVAAVRREAVDLRRGTVAYGPVMERDGTIREYPKGARSKASAGFRTVPVGDDLLARLRPLVVATPSRCLVFTAAEGGPMRYPTWLRRVWNAALRVPVLDERGWPVKGPDGKPRWTPLVAEPLPTPHDCRHTYGTRLGDAGVERHDLMALMGHDDYRSSARYVHSDEERRHERARAAMRRARGA